MSKPFKQLTYEKRLEIKKMLDADAKTPARAIADKIGVHHSTVSREIKKGMIDGTYNPEYAEEQAQLARAEKGRVPILESDTQLAALIADMILSKHLSPEKIANIIKADNRYENVSINTIYNAIDKGLIPGVTRESLRSTYSTIFSGGQIQIPKWVMEQLNLKDGDILQFEISADNEIIYKKQ